jgi:hypothetical protein
MDEIRIRDVSGPATREWVPPIGVMGGPPAHELYRDLVLYAGLRLFRDPQGNPCLALRDGEHRRYFRVPSEELREALDRFRMRRNLRPLPDHELSDLARIVQARVTDPDIFIPTYDPGEPASRELHRELRLPGPGADPRAPTAPSSASRTKRGGWVEELDSIMREVDQWRLPPPAQPPAAKAPSAWNDVVEHLDPVAPAAPIPPDSISGGRAAPPPVQGLPRYVQVFQQLVREGGWLGTTSELSTLTGDAPEKVFANLRAYRTDLAGSKLVVVPVETELGWRWLAVDRTKLSTSR